MLMRVYINDNENDRFKVNLMVMVIIILLNIHNDHYVLMHLHYNSIFTMTASSL